MRRGHEVTFGNLLRRLERLGNTELLYSGPEE